MSTETPGGDVPARTRPGLRQEDLRTLRWIACHVAVALLAVAFLLLGRWQWHAGHRVAPLTERQLTSWRTPESVDRVITADAGLDGTRIGQAVEATGTYDAARQLLVPGRTLGGRTGYDVLAPLVTAQGEAVVVNRGWLASTGSAEPAIPAPPSGRIRVVGWAAEPESPSGVVNQNGIAQAAPTASATGPHQIAVISPAQLVNRWPYQLLDGYVSATDAASGSGGLIRATPAPLPPHGTTWDLLNVGYAFQWCLFALILVGWYGLHLRRELGGEASAAGPDQCAADDSAGAVG